MRIPGILGLIDCFVVKILKPVENEEAFVHHKYQHSLNVQAVCILILLLLHQQNIYT